MRSIFALALTVTSTLGTSASAQAAETLVTIESAIPARAQASYEKLVALFVERGAVRYVPKRLTIKAATDVVKRAYKAYVNGEVDLAYEIATLAIERLHQPVASYRADDVATYRSLLMEALVIASQASYRRKDTRAMRTYLEMIERGFPDQRIPLTKFSPESSDRRRKVAQRMARRKRAQLTIETNDGGDIYIDGKKVGAGRVSVRLVSGQYRVYAKSGDAASATTTIEAKAGQTHELKLPLPQGADLAKVASEGSERDVVVLRLENKTTVGRLFSNGERLIERELPLEAGPDEQTDFVETLLQRTSEGGGAPTSAPIVVPRLVSRGMSFSDTTGLSGAGGLMISGLVIGGGVLLDPDRQNTWMAVGTGLIATSVATLTLSSWTNRDPVAAAKVLRTAGLAITTVGAVFGAAYFATGADDDRLGQIGIGLGGGGMLLFASGLALSF